MGIKTMQLQNITFNDAQFNLLLNRYQDTKTIAISIQEIDEDFKRPNLVISNQQFSYNNKLYQLLVIEQPLF